MVGHPTYDVLIRGGTVYDGSGREGFAGDVGIQGGTIARCGPAGVSGTARGARALRAPRGVAGAARGAIAVAAGGMAVAWGFVNMQSWAVVAMIEDRRSPSD